MRPEEKYKNLDLSFWANVRFLNQRLGYFKKTSEQIVEPVIPTVEQVIEVYEAERFDYSQIVVNNKFTELGELINEYLIYRGKALINIVLPSLMDKRQAKELFDEVYNKLNPNCIIPMNKQKGDKREYAFLTGLVNMIIESNIGDCECNYDPKELTMFTHNNAPIRTLSRRIDGAFPNVKDPIAIWEIKEYYNTTTFGSRVADGVYETQLDGWELYEVKANLKRNIRHYLIVDDRFTWWEKGRSYLCRLIDIMHLGLVTEVIFGREVVTRLPIIVNEWKREM